ncbi:MAG TPA: HD domain-containing phosphohydrolase [bacterium]|nr:HD domain-containing phosphohydrolase [bacterium]
MGNLRTKAAAVVALGVIVLVALLYGAAQLTLLPSYVDLERRQITEHVERVRDALLAEVDDLDRQLGDWAAWDETYDYAAKPSTAYVERNIPEATFADLRLSAMAIFNTTGKMLYGRGFDLATRRPTALSAAFRNVLRPSSALVSHRTIDSSIKGILLLPEGPMLVASRPVLTSNRTGPLRGAMIWGRYLDAREVSRLANITHLTVAAKPLGGGSDAPGRVRPGTGQAPIEVVIRPDGMVFGATVLSDIFGRPALEVSVVEPRTVVKQGQAIIWYFLGWFAASGLAFGLFVVSLYDRLAASRHERRATEERYRALVDQASPMAIFAVDRAGRLQTWNPAAERLFGWNMKEVLRKPPPMLREDAQDAYSSLFADISTTGNPAGIETTLKRRDGIPIAAEISATALRGPAGIEGMMAVVTDLTARKEAAARIERQLQRLAALRMIDSAITASLELKVTLDVLLDQVTSQLGIDAANVLLFDRQLQRLNFGAGRGFRTGVLQYSNLRLGEGLAGVAALERRLVHVADLRADPGTLARAPHLAREDFVTYFAVPLIAKGDVQGVLEVFHREQIDTDDEWIRFLEALAGQAAIAIDNSRLFENLQRASSELSLAYDATLEGWSRALDLRDQETEGHTQRVTDLTLRLAQSMGIGDDDLIHARRGALLHDIGKMGIPDSILLKPDRLTGDERQIIERHPTYAYALLSPIPFLRKALDIPHCHHEKWDGTGYPRGLRGDAIPLSARVFAVVDVWDALTTDRPYRAAWPPPKALAYITEQAGRHFDPAVVDAFVQLLNAGGLATPSSAPRS